MPKKPIDYTKPIIFYKFVKKNDPTFINCYVGHTSNWIKRKNSHKERCNTENNKKYNLKVYQIMRENGGWDNFEMIEIKREICIDNIDARKKEQELIDEMDAKMNSFRSYRSEEYYKDYHKQKNLEYKDKRKEIYENNKEEIKKNQRDYHLKNKEEINQKRRETYENNKEEINQKRREKITCICGSIICKVKKSRHEKSLKHQEYLSYLSNI